MRGILSDDFTRIGRELIRELVVNFNSDAATCLLVHLSTCQLFLLRKHVDNAKGCENGVVANAARRVPTCLLGGWRALLACGYHT